jgi:hypothetical protein
LPTDRKVLRKIFEPKYQGGNWYRRTNRELYELFKEENVVKFIKLRKLRWPGHVMRLNDNDPSKKVMMSEPGGSRPRGRPKLRWEDHIAEDATRAGCRIWKRTAHSSQDWRKLLQEAKAHPGLLYRRRRKGRRKRRRRRRRRGRKNIGTP